MTVLQSDMVEGLERPVHITIGNSALKISCMYEHVKSAGGPVASPLHLRGELLA
jgi:hypothetical protein